MSVRVLGLFKFGKRNHIQEFCLHGRLYMNPLSYFRQLEGDPLRGDRDESVSWTFPSSQATLQVEIDGSFRDIPGIVGPIRHRQDSSQNANTFCMYALRRSEPQTLVDERNLAFGDTFALITDGDEFLRRVGEAHVPSGHRLHWQLVEYMDPESYLGPMGVFRKYSAFQYQSEFRIGLFPGTGEALSIDAGDLSDITTIGRLAEINGRIRVVSVSD